MNDTIPMPFMMAAQIDRLRVERGDPSAEATVTALPGVWAERQILMHRALEDLRGELDAAEVRFVLEVMRGAGGADWRELGSRVTVRIVASTATATWGVDDARGLARRLNLRPTVVRAALELWCDWLWRRERDRELWAHELGWITTQGAAVG